MRQKIVAGNWKMNTTLQEGLELVKKVISKINTIPRDVKLIVCPPSTHLNLTSETILNNPIGVGAQDCSDKDSGAFTGEISAAMVKATGAKYVIIGHSERREYFNETDECLLNKVNQALSYRLIPIFCCGEKLEQRESNNHFDVVKEQLKNTVFKLDITDFERLIIAYEPVWAIGTGKTASPMQAQEMHEFIRSLIKEQYSLHTAEKTSILYGGSCKPANAKELFTNDDVDGGLIGGASLKADDFIAIANAF